MSEQPTASIGDVEQKNGFQPKWWYRFYPEFQYLDSHAEIRNIRRLFNQRVSRDRLKYPMAVLGIIAGAETAMAVQWLASLGVALWFSTLLHTLFWAAVGVCFTAFAVHRPYIKFVRRYLQKKGVAICISCGYDLRAQQQARCPECGLQFQEKLLQAAHQRT